MAKLVDKDPFVYEQEKSGFLQTLHQFLASKGTPFSQTPSIDAKGLDLYLLYLKVTEFGGYQKVTDEEQWGEVLGFFRLPGNCSHAANALREVYARHLELYEKVHFLGEDDDDKVRGPRSYGTPVRTNVSSQKGYQVPSMACRELLPNISEYDKLCFSLLSGLPNEVDFAINVCTLLSNEGRHVLHLDRAPRLIDHLLAHAGVFFEGPGSLRALYQGSWQANTDRDFIKFWYDTVNDDEVQEIIGPEPFIPPEKQNFKDPQLFCQRKLGLLDVEGQRILQIAIILKNLSFESANRCIMAAHRTLYRFLLLCIHNSSSMLRQVGMDTLSNLAPEFILDSIAYRSTQLMFHTIYKGLEDDDRFIVLRSLEVVEKLLEVSNNIDVLEQCLEHRVYHTVINLLHIHDIQILLGALELLLVMSERGSRFCTFICKVDRSIDVLVCLVTLDAQSLGADAFVGIKIIDPNPENQQQQQQPTPQQRMAGGPRPGLHHAPTPPPPQPQPQVTPGAKSPARGGASVSVTPGTSTPPATPLSTKEAEAERFACQWLNCHVESNKESSVARVELYAEYLADCKQAKGNVLSSTNFARCVRLSHPHVGIKKVIGVTAQYHLSGICRRKQPLPFQWQPQEAVTNAVLSSNSRTASTMMAHLASRHSPSPNAINTASPPPPRPGSYPPPHQGGTPHQQRGQPPPPPLYSQGQQMAPFHQGGYPHGSPQVMNVRTGYPPGVPPQMTRGGSLPPYQSPQHPQPSQQYRPSGGMAPSRLIFSNNTEGSSAAPGTPQQTSSQPLPFPQVPHGTHHVQQGGTQMALHGLPQMPPPNGPQMAAGGPPMVTGAPQMVTGVPQIATSGPQMMADGPQIELGRPPLIHGQGLQGPHIQLGGPPPSAASISSNPSGPIIGIQQQQHSLPSVTSNAPAPNGLVVWQGTNGNIVLQRAPEVSPQDVPSGTSEGIPAAPTVSDPAAPPLVGLHGSPAPPVKDSTSPPVSEPAAQSPAETSITSTAPTEPQESSTSSAESAPVDSPLDPPQPPIPPPSNPMVDALSPTGRSTPCSSEVSVRSQADSEPASNITTDGAPEQKPTKGDLLAGEIRIQKVANACADGDNKPNHQPPTISASDCAIPPKECVSGESSAKSVTHSEGVAPPNEAPTANIPPAGSSTGSTRPLITPTANVPILPRTSKPLLTEPQLTASGNKITVTVPTIVHTNKPFGTGTIVNPVVHQVIPASGHHPPGQIRNVLVPSQGIVLNVQPMVPGQMVPGNMQITTQSGISLQPRPATPRQQLINIQPKPIQPKQSTTQAPQTISIQPSGATLIPGQPMMALQHNPGAPGGAQIVLGQSFVVQPSNPGQGAVVRPQFVTTGIQQRMPFQQGQAMVVTASQPNPPGVTQSGGAPQMVSFTPQVGNLQNTDAPLIKRLLQQSTPNRQPLPVGQSQQMQLVQSSQGQLVAVNTSPWPPPAYHQQKQGGLVNIAPRPPQNQQQYHPQSNEPQQLQQPQYQLQPAQSQQLQQQPQAMHHQNQQQYYSQGIHQQAVHPQQQYHPQLAQPHLPLPAPHQPLNLPMCDPVQYPFGGLPPPPPSIDRISLPGDLSSPTSSTSSGSKSKKSKKSKHKKSKKSKKQHSSSCSKQSQRSQSPASGSRDSESVISETVSEANPSENSQDSMDHQIMVPPTPDINDPLRIGFTNILPPNSGPNCNGDAQNPAGTPKKPPARRSKPKSPKPAMMTPPVTPNKIVNGVGEEIMTPVEALIQRIENPHYIDPENQRTIIASGQPSSGDNGITCPMNKAPGNCVNSGSLQGDCKNPVGEGVDPRDKRDSTALTHGKRTASGDCKPSEKNLNNSNNDMKESVVNHFINGAMTDDFLKNQLTTALEDKLQKEIAKSIRRSIEKDSKAIVGSGVEKEETLQQNNKKKQLSNCDSFVNNIIFSGDQRLKTNGPIVNGDCITPVNGGQPPYSDDSSNNVRRGSCKDSDTTVAVTTNGYLLSPNASVSSSPIGSPPPLDHSRLAGPIVTSQHQGRAAALTGPPQEQQRGVKRSADEMTLIRCDTPSSVGSGPLSPPGPPKPAEAPTKKSSSKKRRSSSTSSSGRRERKSSGKGKSHQQAPPQPPPMSAFFICEWNGCRKNLSSAKTLHAHTYREHVMSEGYKGVCEWDGCDNIKRQRWSTVTHIQEKHCSEEALLMAAERRTQRNVEAQSKEPAPPPNPVVYNAHSAYHAIRRSLQPPSLTDLLGEKEGPVTSSIRITASLILKNIAKYSEEGKSLILCYEDRLSHVALSKAEASTTISKCLWLARQDDDR